MKTIFFIMALLIATTTMAQEQKSTQHATEYGQDATIVIWDNNKAPHSNEVSEERSYIKPTILTNTSEARLYYYKADESKSTGQAVVICPGGAYWKLSIAQEGYLMGQWFAENGVAAFVLEYRIPNGHREVPFEDAVEAIRIVRKRAKRFNIDPTKVGLMGSSAGGHLAASVATMATEKEKPNFSILFYPVIASHTTSFSKLLGKGASPAEHDAYKLHNRVNATTPPAILFHCADDKSVPSTDSRLYHEALRQQGIKSAMYIFPKGGHGWGCSKEFKYRGEWQTLLLHWLHDIDSKE